MPAPVDQIVDDQPTTPRQGHRRTRQSDSILDNAPLVFIETAADKVQSLATVVDEEVPHRRTPRPRKPRETVSEPLVFVETKPGDQTQQPTP